MAQDPSLPQLVTAVGLVGVELCGIEDTAYGLRWLEVAHDLRFDLSQSVEHRVLRALLNTEGSEA